MSEFLHPKPKGAPHHDIKIWRYKGKVFLTINNEKTYEFKEGESAELQIDYPTRMKVWNNA